MLDFPVLVHRGAPRGYLTLAQPMTFDEQVRLQRALRDLEEEEHSRSGRRGIGQRTIALLPVVHTMHTEGQSIRAIAAATGLCRQTVNAHVVRRSKSAAMRFSHQRRARAREAA
jgi:DNA-binding NarL/FixJ family response regulator